MSRSHSIKRMWTAFFICPAERCDENSIENRIYDISVSPGAGMAWQDLGIGYNFMSSLAWWLLVRCITDWLDVDVCNMIFFGVIRCIMGLVEYICSIRSLCRYYTWNIPIGVAMIWGIYNLMRLYYCYASVLYSMWLTFLSCDLSYRTGDLWRASCVCMLFSQYFLVVAL